MAIDKFQMQQANYEWQMNSINNADSKISLLITLNLAFIGFILVKMDKIIKDYEYIFGVNYGYLLVGALITITISLAFSIYSIWPRLSKNRTSIFYYNSICNLDKDSYSSSIVSIDEASALKDLSEQVWILSGIASKKYKYIQKGFCFLSLGVILILLSYGLGA